MKKTIIFIRHGETMPNKIFKLIATQSLWKSILLVPELIYNYFVENGCDRLTVLGESQVGFILYFSFCWL